MNLVRLLVAFCFGLVALHLAQRMWMTEMADRVAAQSRTPVPFLSYKPVVPAARYTADQIVPTMPPIDTSAGVQAGLENAARQADLARRHALSLVPLH